MRSSVSISLGASIVSIKLRDQQNFQTSENMKQASQSRLIATNDNKRQPGEYTTSQTTATLNSSSIQPSFLFFFLIKTFHHNLLTLKSLNQIFLFNLPSLIKFITKAFVSGTLFALAIVLALVSSRWVWVIPMY